MDKQYGIIYDASWEKPRGVTVISSPSTTQLTITSLFYFPLRTKILSQNEMIKNALQGIGLGLILVSIVGLLLTLQPIFFPFVQYKAKTFAEAVAGEDQKQTLLEEKLSENAEKEKEKAKLLAEKFGIENTDFFIYIPKINARAKIIQDVDPGNKQEYMAALKKDVAHALGSSLPGMLGGTYIFSHSTSAPAFIARYNAVFYLLWELKPEEKDEIYVFYKNRVFKYRVSEKRIVDADDTSWLLQAKDGPERLILQACWPPGTTWKRLIIVAYPEKISGENAI